MQLAVVPTAWHGAQTDLEEVHDNKLYGCLPDEYSIGNEEATIVQIKSWKVFDNDR